MIPPRRLKAVLPDELARLSEARLLAYRKKALSLENSPEESDYSAEELQSLDANYIWFKSDPRWKLAYEQVLAALKRIQRTK